MLAGMIGRKIGMMSLYDGGGRRRACTVVELGPNRVTQIRTTERDGYEAVQLGFSGTRKRNNRPERGHLRRAGVEDVVTRLNEFDASDVDEYTLGQTISIEEFAPGQYVNATGVSKGRGFAGGVKRWHFAGGPKTHGQSDKHRGPGSVGAGTTPGRTWRGQKMAGHMGSRRKTVINLLVVAVDPTRNLLFIEGSVPGAKDGMVTITRGRRTTLEEFPAPEIPGAAVVEMLIEETPPEEPVVEEPAVAEATSVEDEAAAPEASDEASTEDASDEPAASEEAPEDVAPDADAEDEDEPKSEASE